ncbi:MAG TPA: hypothetical protein VFL12_09150 [Thermoanaerobaculia bacterium]|nr:hypothetical protein [Thermoanaerobaculia bacterium]
MGGSMIRRRLALFAVLAISARAFAQADRGGRLGNLDFPTSTKSAEAQEAFVRGVLLLHSFEYADAAAEFRRAEALDRGFAMAYWGEAMTENHPVWNQRDAKAAREALAKLDKTPAEREARASTEREKAYLRAVDVLFADGEKKERDAAYAEEMRKLHEAFPKDDEATLFYALALLGSCEGERDVPVYEKAGALASDVFARRPDHPGAAHYVIHSYDDPAHAERALPAARAYAKIAPAATHALHMPSHIFLALGMWDDVIASNEASWKASKGTSYHALYWLEYAYLQEGRRTDAARCLAEMERAAAREDSQHAWAHLAWMRAAALVDDPRDAAAASIRIPSGKLFPEAGGDDAFATGFAALGRGDTAAADEALAALTKIAEGSGEGKPVPSILRDELHGTILARDGKTDDAVRLLGDAAEREEKMPYGFGPPDPVKPARELLGEVLLAAGRKSDAAEAFRAELVREPKRRLSLAGLASASN